jgi:CubicO group peptidase (beta-lactamase class C family)
MMAHTVSAVALSLSLVTAGCFFDGKLKHDTGVVPEDIGDGWEIATPESVGLSPKVLDGIHEELLREDRYRSALSFMVVKDGKLVWETYLRSRSDQRRAAPIQSATKSVTSLVFGVALDRSDVASVEVRLGEIFPDELAGLDHRKADITFDDLLTMRSGLDFHNDDFYADHLDDEPSDRVRYMLEKPLFAAPGKTYDYRDIDPQLVSDALTRLTGSTEREIAEETLFSALGIHDFYWEPWPDGVTLGAAGLLLIPRDLAKLGQMVLDGGLWKGERVLSEAWLLQSTREHVETGEKNPFGGVFGYGYYWWVVPGVGFAAHGHGGQVVLVVPARDLVLVETAYPYSSVGDDDLAAFLDLVRPLL